MSVLYWYVCKYYEVRYMNLKKLHLVKFGEFA